MVSRKAVAKTAEVFLSLSLSLSMNCRDREMSASGALASSDLLDPQGSRVARIYETGLPTLYTTIPLEAGSLERTALDFISVDGSGAVVARGESPPHEIVFFVSTGDIERVHGADLQTGGPKLSSDGRWFLFSGSFGTGVGLNIFDREKLVFEQISATNSIDFSVDSEARQIAFQSDHESPRGQYMLADRVSGDTLQLTDDPQAIVLSNGPDDCPYSTGTIPTINDAGTRVAIATRATLGLVAADSAVGCHIVVYEIEPQQFRYVTGLPKALTFSRPAISANGRWLSFGTSRPIGNGFRRYTAALLDLDTGALTESILGPPGERDQTFESIMTADASHIVLTSNADLDPDVGNADQNMELFILDRATGGVRQVTDTTGGIGPGSGTCRFPSFDVNSDGSVIAVLYPSAEELPCRFLAPPRHRSTGLYYRATRIVKKRPGNQGPLWDPPAEVAVDAGRTLTVDFAATDPDGDRLTFFAQAAGDIDLPRGASFEDHRDGTARFVWPTRVEQAGAYQVRFAVFDEGGGERVQDVTIVIRPRGGAPCAADCNGDGQVTVDELVTGVRAALGQAAVDVCPPADVDGDGAVTVEELIRATGDALGGCAPAAQ
jgi:Bacterial Ig domain/EF hand